MSYPRFPLPRLPITGYSYNVKDDLIRDAMEGGYPSARPRSTRVLYELKMTVQVTTEELGEIMIFHDATLVKGSLPFTYELSVMKADGTYLSFGEQNMVFSSPPSFKYSGIGTWEIGLEMEMI